MGKNNGVNYSNGVNSSFGIINSYGVDRALFLADKPRQSTIFGVEVSADRFNFVMQELYGELDGWRPKFNNALELYIKNGSDWAKVDVSHITETLKDWDKPYEAWKDMPKEAIEYLQSLPEFNADIFKRVTGIDVTQSKVQEFTLVELAEKLGVDVKNLRIMQKTKAYKRMDLHATMRRLYRKYKDKFVCSIDKDFRLYNGHYIILVANQSTTKKAIYSVSLIQHETGKICHEVMTYSMVQAGEVVDTMVQNYFN
jgi:hypothetical protein